MQHIHIGLCATCLQHRTDQLMAVVGAEEDCSSSPTNPPWCVPSWRRAQRCLNRAPCHASDISRLLAPCRRTVTWCFELSASQPRCHAIFASSSSRARHRRCGCKQPACGALPGGLPAGLCPSGVLSPQPLVRRLHGRRPAARQLGLAALCCDPPPHPRYFLQVAIRGAFCNSLARQGQVIRRH